MTRKQTIYEFLRKMKSQRGLDATYSTEEIANAVGASRANVSSDLNRLFEEQLVEKLPGWPVKYRASSALLTPMPATKKSAKLLAEAEEVFAGFVGHNGSMSMQVEKAKAAVLYPLNGLPLLIGGKTGVGKTTFAKLLYEYAKRAERISSDAKFVSFNCADYSNNPQLIMAQLFGYARGAYTGADEEHAGLVEAADGGVLFLDEVHRLPETAQEMLFFLMDFSQYRRLGEADIMRTSHPIIIMATTEDKESALLATFNRRIPISITLPALSERIPYERFQLIRQMFLHEAVKLKLDLTADALTVKALLAYECPGNIGQLENDIRVACARAYVEYLMGNESGLSIRITDFPYHVKEGLRRIKYIYSDINLIATDIDIRVQGNEPIADPSSAFSPEPGTNIYDVLEQQYTAYSQSIQDKDYLELAMTLDMESYIRRLMAQHDGGSAAASIEFLSQTALDVAKKAEDIVACELGIALDERGRKIVATHLDTAISRVQANKQIVCPSLSSIREEQPAIFDTASQVILYMRNECGLNMPDDEIGFVANLLLRVMDEAKSEVRAGILVLCHGLGSASTMAKIADTILGKKSKLCSLDLTDKHTDAALKLAVEAKLDELQGCGSYLVLTDSAMLADLCLNLAKKREEPLYAMDNISTSMVVEAAMLVTEQHATAQQVYHHLKQLEPSFSRIFEVETAKLVNGQKNHAIVTACISGCGAAVKLKRIIEDNFELLDDVEIVTMDISSIGALKKRIAELSSVKEIICIVGMDVGLNLAFPFISMEEFVLGNGIQRLANVLGSYNIHYRTQPADRDGPEKEGPEALDATRSELESTFFSGKYLGSYLFYLDAEKMLPYLIHALDNIEMARGPMRRGKRIMLCIHLCSMVERLIFEHGQTGGAPENVGHADLVEALAPLSSTYGITITREECDMIEQILDLVLDKE